ncbi:MAG: hypothetical protein JSS91_05005 [Bacteroidetes bacterium]|nr:hypothetical protein [Bacteroidota bacterium]
MNSADPLSAYLKDMDSFFYGGNCWQAEIVLPEKLHRKMKSLVRRKGTEIFNLKNSFSNYIREKISRDAYHAGQLGLLRVMQGLKAAVY